LLSRIIVEYWFEAQIIKPKVAFLIKSLLLFFIAVLFDAD
jgi:hypothetical protein